MGPRGMLLAMMTAPASSMRSMKQAAGKDADVVVAGPIIAWQHHDGAGQPSLCLLVVNGVRESEISPHW